MPLPIPEPVAVVEGGRAAPTVSDALPHSAPPAKVGLLGLHPHQWRSGIAAWLGWLFDGLDMHLYTMVAPSFVPMLLANRSGHSAVLDSEVKIYSGWIGAAFLVGWALGGGFFGRIGDRMGRSRALALTVLTYALFTGLSAAATQWWHLLIFRFLAALGIGGEWAVGSSLLSETWPKAWRPWIAAALQTGVNVGVMLAYAVTFAMAAYNPRWVFLAGVLPAVIVYWIRKSVPEPEEWHAARSGTTAQPGMADLFRGPTRRLTLLTIVVCACALTAWWAFMFWIPHLMAQHPDVASWTPTEKKRLSSAALAIPVFVSIPGNFFAAALARVLGFRRAIAALCLGFGLAIVLACGTTHPWKTMLFFFIPLVGFFSGIFGLFTMYLPPLFPTLLRTTGAGFCYNIGRLAAAAGVVWFAVVAVSQKGAQQGDLRLPLLYGAFLFLPAMGAALLMPELKDREPDAA